AYFDYFGAAAGDPSKGYYSYDLGSWHVVALNSVCYEGGSCEIALENWLEADLAANSSSCTVALLHEPRFSSGNIHGNDPWIKPLWQIMYDANVDVVLSGSEHIYERFAKQTPNGVADPQRGIREFIVGTGGRGHYGIGTVQPNSEVRDTDAFGILKMTLNTDSYDWEFLPEAGKSFTDTGSTPCH
ncbi:MAG TPA: alkaline phosphatase, partial [Phycisphaerae bacterium]|nr:alkaline phosphatase [Phycisphaerae bacterium]